MIEQQGVAMRAATRRCEYGYNEGLNLAFAYSTAFSRGSQSQFLSYSVHFFTSKYEDKSYDKALISVNMSKNSLLSYLKI